MEMPNFFASVYFRMKEWRRREGGEGLGLRGRITSGRWLTVAWQSAPDEPETANCGASLHVNPSIGRTALQSKVK